MVGEKKGESETENESLSPQGFSQWPEIIVQRMKNSGHFTGLVIR